MTSVLYIIMRNDTNSMNPGKAMAQASHASNAFVHHVKRYSQKVQSRPVNTDTEISNTKGFYAWENSTPQGFGTVLTLEAKMLEIKQSVDIFEKMGYIAGIVHDPSYPIVDGEIVHHIPLDTCGYIFVPNKEEDQLATAFLKKFPLHR
jgi:peptidyl-tRNA hydrolase